MNRSEGIELLVFLGGLCVLGTAGAVLGYGIDAYILAFVVGIVVQIAFANSSGRGQ